MNKTININLAGLVFYIDEVAYENLEAYLSKIKLYLQNEPDSVEIIHDIEARIAELFRQWKQKDEVISLAEVEKVQEMLGRPEEYLSEDEVEVEKETKSTAKETTTPKEAQLFRDPEQAVLGGVCAGLGHYFGVNRIWVRLIFILLFIGIGWIDMGGTITIIYIILWAIIPKAVTTSDRLKMQGKPVNLENIKGTVEGIGDQLESGIKGLSGKSLNIENGQVGNVLVKIIKIVLKVFIILVVLSLLMGAIAMLFSFLGISSVLLFSSTDYSAILSRLTDYDAQYQVGIVAAIIARQLS